MLFRLTAVLGPAAVTDCPAAVLAEEGMLNTTGRVHGSRCRAPRRFRIPSGRAPWQPTHRSAVVGRAWAGLYATRFRWTPCF